LKTKTDKAQKSAASTGSKNRRASYRQGSEKVYVEPLEDTIAVRYLDESKTKVRKTLSNFGHIRDVQSQRLFIIDFEDESKRDEASKALQELLKSGLIEFFTPVLLDEKSQLHQILTDEISVRFKKVPPSTRLKAVEKKYGVRIARQNEFVPSQFILKTEQPSGLNTLKVASELDAEDEVEFAAPNFISEHRR